MIGLVGGVGSGKSFLAQGIQASRPIAVIDADKAGHEVLEQHDVRDELSKMWGEGILGEDGKVDRRAVARLVFGTDEAALRARHALEQVVHPRIKSRILKQVGEIQANETNRPEAILLDAALLLETGWQDLCDAVVFVDVPASIRQVRVAGRNWVPEEWEKREASQWPIEKKRRAAGFSVTNIDGQTAVAELNEIINQVSRQTF